MNGHRSTLPHHSVSKATGILRAYKPWLPGARRMQFACESGNTNVQFKIQQQVDFGESHKIVGNAPELGQWNVKVAPEMAWNEGDIWTLDVAMAPGSDLEFKVVKVNNGHVNWEGGNNHKAQVPKDKTGPVNIGLSWSKEEIDLSFGSQPSNSQATTNGHTHETNGHISVSDVANGFGGSANDDRPEHLQWKGKSVTFMRANEHSKDRQGVWDASGLEGAAKTIVTGDEKGANWLSKMQVAKKVLVDDAGKYPDMDALANAFIYLQWINSGAIECKEGGGHYRPNKHAELARDIFRALERAIAGELPGGCSREPLITLLARKVQTKLPSFTEQYTQSTPLTRIRDIAHRNDIPHELKQEIKHTIQNKLHRNAGPEDLVATEAMLKRVSEDGSYNQDFVNEFRVFTAELRDFFNAGSFADMLEGLKGALDDQEQEVVQSFLAAKGAADSAGAGQEGLNHLVGCLHSLTSLRVALLNRLSSGLRNDASESSIAMRQKFRLCEIRAEDYAFVILSRILNNLEEQGGAEGLAKGPDSQWALPLGAAVLSIRQIGLGGWEGRECMALENEVGTWQEAGGLEETSNALRLKASLERLQRLTQSYTDALLGVFPSRAAALGKGLGLPLEPVQVFTEAEVRASLVFQLSKLCSLLLKASRLASGGAEWDALVAGEVTGKLVEVDHIEAKDVGEKQEDVILLVKHASGDEEVGASGTNLKGVILCHGLPHLSHLGVRARQEKVVFVACEDDSVVDAQVRPLIGSQVTLSASAQSVTVSAAREAAQTAQGDIKTNTKKAAPKLNLKAYKPTNDLLRMEEARVETCGSKVSACAQLAKLSKRAQSFKTPAGRCLPFGNMEYTIKEVGKLSAFKNLVEEIETAEIKGGALDAACEKLMHLVESAGSKGCRSADAGVLDTLGYYFGKEATVIVRSSANVEDLAGMSGAGLYDSIANVPASDTAALCSAISKVWASLYSRRAVLARRAAGVPQKDAAMAILIQEQLDPDYSFVLHTSSPLDKDDTQLYAEIAAGLGETLASGTRGSPWRLSVEKNSGEVTTLAFANFSQALGKPGGKQDGVSGGVYGVTPMDYSKQELSTNAEIRMEVGRMLAVAGVELEEAFGGPQDVEGAFVDGEIYIVQTRPQP